MTFPSPDVRSQDMYKEQILDLFKHPINQGTLAGATHSAHKHNPSCGDECTLQLLVRDAVVVDAMYLGSGCAISTAAVCLLTDFLKGKSVADVSALSGDDMIKLLGIPVSASRMSCATLSLDCLRMALSKGNTSSGVTPTNSHSQTKVAK